MRILAVRLDNIGDVVMLTPSLRALRSAFPTAHLALLASPGGSALAPLLPWVDEVRPLQALWQQIDPRRQRSPEAELAEIDTLRRARFDAAYLFTSFSQSPHAAASFCHLAGIPIRVGQSKEFGGGVLTTTVPVGPDDEHQVDRSLRLLAGAGIAAEGDHLELRVPQEVARAADRLLAEVGIDPDRPFAVVAPGASAASRRWPAERFGEVARLLHERLGLPAVVVGGDRDRERASVVARTGGPATAVLAGRTSVPELAAVVRRSELVVTGNSAPMHLADAFQRPVVVLFAGTELERQWEPRHTRARLLRRPTACAPCYSFTCPYDLECLDLGPEAVLAAAEEVLGDGVAASAAGAHGRSRR